MAFKKRVRGWWTNWEEPKDHEAIPDSLGIGIREDRDPDGQLVIYLKPGKIPTPYVVLGKYAQPQEDGTEYYVADWTKAGVNPLTTKHVHLLMAIAHIQELVEALERTDHENL